MSNGLNRPRLNGREAKPKHQYRHVMEHGFIRKFTWRERLKIALGYEASFEIKALVMHNPGANEMSLKTSLSSPFKVWALSKMARVSAWFRGKVTVVIGILLLAMSAGAQTNNWVDLTNPVCTNHAMLVRREALRWGELATNGLPGVTCTNKTEEDIILAYRRIKAAREAVFNASEETAFARLKEDRAWLDYTDALESAFVIVTNTFTREFKDAADKARDDNR